MRTPESTEASLPEPLLDLGGVATLLNVSRRTVERLVTRGELVPFRIGACVRFDPAEVRELLERSRKRPRKRAAAVELRVAGGSSQTYAERLRSRGAS